MTQLTVAQRLFRHYRILCGDDLLKPDMSQDSADGQDSADSS